MHCVIVSSPLTLIISWVCVLELVKMHFMGKITNQFLDSGSYKPQIPQIHPHRRFNLSMFVSAFSFKKKPKTPAFHKCTFTRLPCLNAKIDCDFDGNSWTAFVGIPINSWMKIWPKTPLLSFGIKPQLSKTGRNAVIDCSSKYCRIIILQVPHVKTTLFRCCKWRFSFVFLFLLCYQWTGFGGKLHRSISKLFFSPYRLLKLHGN